MTDSSPLAPENGPGSPPAAEASPETRAEKIGNQNYAGLPESNHHSSRDSRLLDSTNSRALPVGPPSAFGRTQYPLPSVFGRTLEVPPSPTGRTRVSFPKEKPAQSGEAFPEKKEAKKEQKKNFLHCDIARWGCGAVAKRAASPDARAGSFLLGPQTTRAGKKRETGSDLTV